MSDPASPLAVEVIFSLTTIATYIDYASSANSKIGMQPRVDLLDQILVLLDREHRARAMDRVISASARHASIQLPDISEMWVGSTRIWSIHKASNEAQRWAQLPYRRVANSKFHELEHCWTNRGRKRKFLADYRNLINNCMALAQYPESDIRNQLQSGFDRNDSHFPSLPPAEITSLVELHTDAIRILNHLA